MIRYNKNAFTLVEVVVALTIFSIVSISMIWIYLNSKDVISKSDINRKMQENAKNVVNQIAEDIRINGISGISKNKSSVTCDLDFLGNKTKSGSQLCTSLNTYYLAKKDPILGSYVRKDNNECKNLEDDCVIYELNKGPLTNSFVSVKSLNFITSETGVPKVTILIEFKPSIKKGIKRNLIKESDLIFQTTISQRPF